VINDRMKRSGFIGDRVSAQIDKTANPLNKPMTGSQRIG